MRKLGDQWIEIIDGQEHMLKAVELTDSDFIDRIAMGEGGTCCICPLYKQCKASGNMEDFCPVGDSSSERSDYDDVFIKDLGILKNGVLPSPFPDGGYPTIQRGAHWGEEEWVDCYWAVYKAHKIYICTGQFPTEQEAIDAWNRRA